jgi:hypothetical protein
LNVFLSTLNDDHDDKDDILQNRREQIDRAKESQDKRKIEDDLSLNINIKKTKDRMINFISLKRELKMRKNANKQIIDRIIRVLKRTNQYENALKNEKIRLIEQIKEKIVIKR